MEKITRPLSLEEIKALQKRYGSYAKVVVDLSRGVLVIGCELHIDGVRVLVNDGSLERNIWGGGISWPERKVDTTAVFNLRPFLGNESMEILDSAKRKKFIEIVTKYLLK